MKPQYDEPLSNFAFNFNLRRYIEDAKCVGEKRALDACLAYQARQPKSSNTINYHLQRLSRLAKR